MKKKENKTSVLVDPKVYSLEAVYAAAYLFLDRAYFFLEEGPKSKIKINIKGRDKLTEKKLKNLEDEFLNELLNSSLRDRISKNNKKIREYILGRVLTSALNQDSQGKVCDYSHEPKKIQENKPMWDKNDLKEEFTKEFSQNLKEDPEEIAATWEEKNLKDFTVPWREKEQKNKSCGKKAKKSKKKPKKK